ncbi:MAG: insulinase family protein [Ignavibacteriae bacterium]|nr:insulinase family protein [Ignavibacteriota bacterium]
MNVKPPVSKKIYDFHFPEYSKKIIAPGKILYFIEKKDSPLFNLKIISSSGAFDDSTPGLSNLTTQMTLKGTKNRSQEKISEELDYLGINLNASASWDMCSWNLICLDEHKNKAIRILGDCLNNSVFPKKEIEILKGRILADLSQKKAEPSYLARQAFYSGIYQDSPYGIAITGNDKNVEEINKNQLLEKYNEHLNRSRITFIVTTQNGSLDTTEMINKIISFNPVINKKNKIKSKKIKINNNLIRLAEKTNAEQTALRLGKISIGINHPDYIPLSLANIIFGGYFMSRLNGVIREKLGYTYGIHSFIDYKLRGSTFQISSSVNKSTTAKTISTVFKLMDKFSKEIVKIKEFERARKYFLGSFLRNIESNQQIMTLINVIELFNLKSNYYDETYKLISNLTPEDIFKVQQKYFAPENIVIAAAGDINYLEKELKNFCEINYYQQ